MHIFVNLHAKLYKGKSKIYIHLHVKCKLCEFTVK